MSAAVSPKDCACPCHRDGAVAGPSPCHCERPVHYSLTAKGVEHLSRRWPKPDLPQRSWLLDAADRTVLGFILAGTVAFLGVTLLGWLR